MTADVRGMSGVLWEQLLLKDVGGNLVASDDGVGHTCSVDAGSSREQPGKPAQAGTHGVDAFVM